MHGFVPFLLAGLAIQSPPQDASSKPSAAPASYAGAIHAAVEHKEKGELDQAQRALDSTELTSRGFEWAHLTLAIELAREAGAGPGLRATGRVARPAVPPARVEAISHLRGHDMACRAVAISPAGDRIASCGLGHEIRLWNGRTGDLVRLLAGHDDAVMGLAFSPAGDRLASASLDGSARIWDVVGGREIAHLVAKSEPMCAIAWSPDGAWIATADATMTVRLWKSTASEARLALRGHTGPITSIAFSSDSKLCASSSEDGTVRIVDVASGDLVRALALDGVAVRVCRFDPSETRVPGTRLTVALQDGSVRRFDTATGSCTQKLSGSVVLGALAFTADGQRFATGSDEGIVQLFDAEGTPLLVLHVASGAIRSLAFDARATRLVACGDDRAVHVIETDATLARALQRAAVRSLPSVEAAALMKPLEVDALCRRVVEHAGLEAELYTSAETLARATLERVAGSGQVHTTLGGAIYRLERFDEALTALTAAGDEKRGWPPNLAFRAMALAKLARTDDSRLMLNRLETLVQEERWQADIEVRALLDETRTVVAAARPSTK